jgi:hypothetical protein
MGLEYDEELELVELYEELSSVPELAAIRRAGMGTADEDIFEM